MGLENVPRCQHLKVNGVQCGSPALRRRRRCYFHEGIRLEQEKFHADQFAQRRFELPPLEDANAVQLGLMKVIEWLGSGRMEPKIAGLMLYALQTASCNLRHTKFEAEKVTDVVIDQSKVDRTPLNGPQWAARDFTGHNDEAENDQAENDDIAASAADQAAAQASQAGTVQREADQAEGRHGGDRHAAADPQNKSSQDASREDEISQDEDDQADVRRAKARAEEIYAEGGRMARAIKIEQESTFVRDCLVRWRSGQGVQTSGEIERGAHG
ncbi:MAG: hypothetical protein WAL56_11320 [Candidatus Sulfotelmatobacter sp.]